MWPVSFDKFQNLCTLRLKHTEVSRFFNLTNKIFSNKVQSAGIRQAPPFPNIESLVNFKTIAKEEHEEKWNILA